MPKLWRMSPTTYLEILRTNLRGASLAIRDYHLEMTEDERMRLYEAARTAESEIHTLHGCAQEIAAAVHARDNNV